MRTVKSHFQLKQSTGSGDVLLLAIAPGYATAVWPASGVALAALLMYGYRMWPAVLLGSALLNSELSYPAQGMQAGLSWLVVAVSIGVGAAL